MYCQWMDYIHGEGFVVKKQEEKIEEKVKEFEPKKNKRIKKEYSESEQDHDSSESEEHFKTEL